MKKIILAIVAALVLVGTSIMNWGLILWSTDRVQAYIGVLVLSTVWYAAAVAAIYLTNLITKGKIKNMALSWLQR